MRLCMDWQILVLYPEPEARDQIYKYPPIHVKTQNIQRMCDKYELLLYISIKLNSNITSFFRFVNKRASYPFGIISLAHVPVNVTDFSIGSKARDQIYKYPPIHVKTQNTFWLP
jgi:hypothetical protein